MYVLAALATFLLMAFLVKEMVKVTQPAPLGSERAAVRTKDNAEIRACRRRRLKSWGLCRPTTWHRASPIEDAMKLTVQGYQNPAAFRSDILARVEKANGSAAQSCQSIRVSVNERFVFFIRFDASAGGVAFARGNSLPAIDASCRVLLIPILASLVWLLGSSLLALITSVKLHSPRCSRIARGWPMATRARPRTMRSSMACGRRLDSRSRWWILCRLGRTDAGGNCSSRHRQCFLESRCDDRCIFDPRWPDDRV